MIFEQVFLINKFNFSVYRHYWASSPLRPECGLECKREILCEAKSGRSRDKLHFCMDLETITEGNQESVEVPKPDSEIHTTTIMKSTSSRTMLSLKHTMVTVLVFGFATVLMFIV